MSSSRLWKVLLWTASIVVTLFALAACGSQTEPTPLPPIEENPPITENEDATGIIVLGDVSDEPAKKIERFQPLADHLAANLSDYGIGVGEVKIAPDMETMIDWLAKGEVDLYIDSLYPAMLISDQSGAQPILRRWKKDVSEYHTVIFTLADSGIETLDDLEGQLIALEDPQSTSGYMLPLAYLIEAGLTPVEKRSPDASVADDMVGYVFSGDDLNTLQWVVGNIVLAGATDNLNYEKLLEDSDVELKILAETESVARNVVLARGDLDADTIDAISALLKNLGDSPEGQEILDLNKTAQFDDFPGGAETALDRMRELYALTQTP